jgi:hypothetical protein
MERRIHRTGDPGKDDRINLKMVDCHLGCQCGIDHTYHRSAYPPGEDRSLRLEGASLATPGNDPGFAEVEAAIRSGARLARAVYHALKRLLVGMLALQS